MKARLPMIFGFVLVIGLLFSACGISMVRGSGQIERETREVSDFTSVEFSGAGELTIIQGETEGLVIETDDNLLPYIESVVEGDTLKLRFKDRLRVPLLRPTESVRFMLTVNSLDEITMSGAGTVYAEQLTAEQLAVVQSGAGTITINELTVDDLNVTLSGAGTIELGGSATNQSVEMSGLGNYKAADLESDIAEVKLSGAGEATVWVHENLDANLSGAGSISYYGSPQVNSSSSGIGSLNSLGDK